ncbi:MFS general substrate transporter, partial [Serendipita vermifera]
MHRDNDTRSTYDRHASTPDGELTRSVQISGVTAVSMAIPSIAKDLDMASDKIPWIVSAFSLSSGCLLLLFGRLADLYGRKLLWLIGAFWIAIMTLGCSFVRTGEQLIVLRAMHGMGPAAMVPAAIGILAQSFPPSRARSFAYAAFSSGAPLGGALGT